MANLDDLFSKRDKKKKTTTGGGTTKSKFSTLDANEFAKQLEATSSRAAAEDGDLDYQQDGGSSALNSNDNLDEEWKPFDSEDNRDYSGLRIIQWKVEDRDSEYGGGNEDGERKSNFVWGANPVKTDDGNSEEKSAAETPAEAEKEKTAQQEPSAEAAESTDKEPAVESKEPAAAGGAYVPPALRRAMQGAGGAAPAPAPAPAAEPKPAAGESKYLPPHLRGKTGDSGSSGLSSSSSSAIPPTSVNFNRNRPGKAQPNIMDTMEFPTLDSAVVSENASEKAVNGGEKFEMPKKAGRIEPKSTDSSINLDNKFKALSTNN